MPGKRNHRADPERTIFKHPKRWTRREPGAPPTRQALWNSANRQKLAAHAAVRKALQHGALRRGTCAVCGSFRVEAHHPDYSKPLDVIWLCRSHHVQLHANLRQAANGHG